MRLTIEPIKVISSSGMQHKMEQRHIAAVIRVVLFGHSGIILSPRTLRRAILPYDVSAPFESYNRPLDWFHQKACNESTHGCQTITRSTRAPALQAGFYPKSRGKLTECVGRRGSDFRWPPRLSLRHRGLRRVMPSADGTNINRITEDLCHA